VIAQTSRLIIREADPGDAGFVNQLLNSPGFLRFIGDRGVRTDEDALNYLLRNYLDSYSSNGFGLYIVEQKSDAVRVGVCGLVKRNSLPEPDLGFAFLPEFEGLGYGTESSLAVLADAANRLKIRRILAITTLDNHASMALLRKLGFSFLQITRDPAGEELNLFEYLHPNDG
jgi:RimJ/RimL family protein N-acetyltransferase